MGFVNSKTDIENPPKQQQHFDIHSLPIVKNASYSLWFGGVDEALQILKVLSNTGY